MNCISTQRSRMLSDECAGVKRESITNERQLKCKSSIKPAGKPAEKVWFAFILLDISAHVRNCYMTIGHFIRGKYDFLFNHYYSNIQLLSFYHKNITYSCFNRSTIYLILVIYKSTCILSVLFTFRFFNFQFCSLLVLVLVLVFLTFIFNYL